MIEDKFQEFYLLREKDISETSGTGVVCRGIILPSGKCVLEWGGLHSSLGIYQNISDLQLIHSHNGATKLIMGSPYDKPKKKKK